ncbi:MAG TPA: ATP-binding protein, partial [Kofleriaceae bacterium]
EIRISLARRGDRVELVVRDTGSGIPAGELDRVFERFHRVEGAPGRTHEGTGIGLALVQELVRLHGGSIIVTSELGRGSAFRVSIPLLGGDSVEATAAKPSSGPNAFVEEAMRWLPDRTDPSGERPPVAAAGSRPRIVVADDNADMRDYLRRLLVGRWEVEAVGNGRVALAAIRRRMPDLVISDVMMPELDGLGLVAAVRADPELRELPIILLSARAGQEARIEGLRAGATDYLHKPFASKELLARVESQLMRAAVGAAERAHERSLQMIFEQAPVSIAILRGPELVYEFSNAPYHKLIGAPSPIGRRVGEVVPELAEQGFVAILERVYRTGERYVGRSVPIQLRRPPAGAPAEMFFDIVYQPLFDASGQVTGIASFGHDVTPIASARRDAEVANRAKDEFLAMLGHELRNPLAPITTALELMRIRPGVGGERERAVIERQVQHLIGLVDDLLDISRITRGKVELRPAAVELAEVVARSVEVSSPLLEEHRHALHVDVPLGLTVLGDPTRLAQIVSNLLTNSAKYTPRGGQLAVRGWRDGVYVFVRVSDNGIGIEPGMLRRIFEPFAQERQAIDRARGGLGLGLAIVDNLTKLHGGSVTATSDGRGHGSAFTVMLPALDAIPEAIPAELATRAPAAGDARILIVDDNVDAAQLLADLLEAGGYTTLVAHDGPSGLTAAAGFQPRLAIVDIGLPVMDGYELGRLLRADHAELQVVALTGYGQPEDRARTAALGFAAHLVKPIDIAQLRQTIARLLA